MRFVGLFLLLNLVIRIVVVILDEESPELEYLILGVCFDNLLEVVEGDLSSSNLDVQLILVAAGICLH